MATEIKAAHVCIYIYVCMYVCVYIYGYSIFKSSLSDIHNLVGVYVYIYMYIYIYISTMLEEMQPLAVDPALSLM